MTRRNPFTPWFTSVLVFLLTIAVIQAIGFTSHWIHSQACAEDVPPREVAAK